jgi:hypothetical protein
VIECEPVDVYAREHVAEPLLNVWFPPAQVIEVDPSLKATVPGGFVEPTDCVTVAV